MRGSSLVVCLALLLISPTLGELCREQIEELRDQIRELVKEETKTLKGETETLRKETEALRAELMVTKSQLESKIGHQSIRDLPYVRIIKQLHINL